MLSQYEKQAEAFRRKTRTKFKAEFVKHDKYFIDDKETRDIWQITLRRNGASYTFKFGQSIANVGEEPTTYDVFSCLTKSDPGTYDNFCSEYGYDTDSRKARVIYRSVVKEWKGVERLFSDVLNELSEIA